METPSWRTSSYSSGTGECVEVADLATGDRAVRDTKDLGAGPVLLVGPREWAAFLHGLKTV